MSEGSSLTPGSAVKQVTILIAKKQASKVGTGSAANCTARPITQQKKGEQVIKGDAQVNTPSQTPPRERLAFERRSLPRSADYPAAENNAPSRLSLFLTAAQ